MLYIACITCVLNYARDSQGSVALNVILLIKNIVNIKCPFSGFILFDFFFISVFFK